MLLRDRHSTERAAFGLCELDEFCHFCDASEKSRVTRNLEFTSFPEKELPYSKTKKKNNRGIIAISMMAFH
jgi:hypothetical protein